MKKHTLQFLMTLLLIIVWQGDLLARKITLTKTGGGTLFYTSANSLPNPYDTTNTPGFILPTFSNGNHTMTFNEPTLTPSKNWTEEFNLIADCINNDVVDNWKTDVHYNIEIDEVQSNLYPYIVGRQSLNSILNNARISPVKNILYVHGSSTQLINHVSIHSSNNNNKAHIKFIDSLYYGSWLKPGAIFRKFKIKRCLDTLGNGCTDTFSNAYPRMMNYAGAYPVLGYSKDTVFNSGTIVAIYYNYPVVIDSMQNTTNNFIKLPPSFAPPQITSLGTDAEIGNLFHLVYMNKVDVYDIYANGNIDSNFVGGQTYDKGIQREHTAPTISTTKHAEVHDCEFNQLDRKSVV